MGLTSQLIRTKAPTKATAPIDSTEMLRIAEELASAKSRQDVAAAMRVYHPQGILEAPPFVSRREGADDIRASLERFFTLFPDYSVTLTQSAVSGETLIGWGEIKMTMTGRPGGQTPNGQRACVPVFILFKFRDGLVFWESFNFDLASLCQQSGVTIDAFFPTKF